MSQWTLALGIQTIWMMGLDLRKERRQLFLKEGVWHQDLVHTHVCASLLLLSPPWSWGNVAGSQFRTEGDVRDPSPPSRFSSDLVFPSSDLQGPTHVSAPGVTNITALCLAATQPLQWANAMCMMKMNSRLPWRRSDLSHLSHFFMQTAPDLTIVD